MEESWEGGLGHGGWSWKRLAPLFTRMNDRRGFGRRVCPKLWAKILPLVDVIVATEKALDVTTFLC